MFIVSSLLERDIFKYFLVILMVEDAEFDNVSDSKSCVWLHRQAEDGANAQDGGNVAGEEP